MKKTLIIILGIVIISIGIFFAINIVNNKNENTNTSSSENIQDANNSATTENMEDKNEDIVNSDQYINISIEEIENLAKEKINKYFELSDYEKSAASANPMLLSELDLEDYDNLWNSFTNFRNTEEYIKTNVTYQDFKNEMLKYVTKEYFNNYYSHYIDMEGFVGVQNVAYGGFETVTVKEIDLISNKNNEYIFKTTLINGFMYDHYIKKK